LNLARSPATDLERRCHAVLCKQQTPQLKLPTSIILKRFSLFWAFCVCVFLLLGGSALTLWMCVYVYVCVYVCVWCTHVHTSWNLTWLPATSLLPPPHTHTHTLSLSLTTTYTNTYTNTRAQTSTLTHSFFLSRSVGISLSYRNIGDIRVRRLFRIRLLGGEQHTNIDEHVNALSLSLSLGRYLALLHKLTHTPSEWEDP